MNTPNGREEHDCLYGRIILNNTLSQIIGTPEFQRLRRIKQLGGACYIFKDATHTRYEHSIGTAYLAGGLVRHLQQLQKARSSEFLNDSLIDEKDILCVEIAALCHDLGHGPFSHAFQKQFLSKYEKKTTVRERSVIIFKEIWQRLMTAGKIDPLLSKDDIHFIDVLMMGDRITQEVKLHRTRKGLKSFLYQLLLNRTSQVDVCKWDYLARDCLIRTGTFRKDFNVNIVQLIGQVGLQLQNDPKDGYTVICAHDLYFRKLQHHLHKTVYQSSQVNAVQHMISDAMGYADEELNLSKHIYDHVNIMNEFCDTDDDVLLKIKDSKSTKESIKKAKGVLERLDDQQYYKCVKLMVVNNGDSNDIKSRILFWGKGLSHDSIRVSTFHYQLCQSNEAPEPCMFKVAQVFCVTPGQEEAVEAACNTAREAVDDGPGRMFANFDEVTRIVLAVEAACNTAREAVEDEPGRMFANLDEVTRIVLAISNEADVFISSNYSQIQ